MTNCKGVSLYVIGNNGKEVTFCGLWCEKGLDEWTDPHRICIVLRCGVPPSRLSQLCQKARNSCRNVTLVASAILFSFKSMQIIAPGSSSTQ